MEGSFARVLQRLEMLMARRRARQALVEEDLRDFEDAYARHYIPGESKPPEVGRPFLLRPLRLRPRGGVVLTHGFLAAPLETRALGEALCRAGYAVYGVRMAGHGTAPEDIALRPWEEWYASVGRGVAILETLTDRIALCGFSIGGCMSLIGAARMSDRLSAVVSICAPLYVRRYMIRLVPSIVGINSLLHRVGADRFRWEYSENHPENLHINYMRNPLTAAKELVTIMAETERVLSTITIPALVIQASQDPTVHPDSGPDIFGQLGSPHKELTIFQQDRHGIINGAGCGEVFSRVEQFLGQSLSLPRAEQPTVAVPAQNHVTEDEDAQAISAV
jgi:esterase/lipase